MLSINFSEVFWAIVNFFLLLFLLKRFLYDPIIHFTDERNERMAAAYRAEADAEQQVHAANAELASVVSQSRADAVHRAALAQNAENERVEALRKQARENSAAVRRTMEERLSAERETLKNGLEVRGPELAACLADRLTEPADVSAAVRADAGMPVSSRDRGWSKRT